MSFKIIVWTFFRMGIVRLLLFSSLLFDFSCGVNSKNNARSRSQNEASSTVSEASKFIDLADGKHGSTYNCKSDSTATGIMVCDDSVKRCYMSCLNLPKPSMAFADGTQPSPSPSPVPATATPLPPAVTITVVPVATYPDPPTHLPTPVESSVPTEMPTLIPSATSNPTGEVSSEVGVDIPPTPTPVCCECMLPPGSEGCTADPHGKGVTDDPRNKAPEGAPWANCPVFKMPYHKRFDCDDFALGFDHYCQKVLNIECYQIGFTGSKKGTSHAFNVVEKGPRYTSYLFWTYTTYCAVEPQSNGEISCWQAQVGEWKPSEETRNGIIEHFNKSWDEDFCAKAWQYWNDGHSPEAGEKPFTKSPLQVERWKDIVGCELPTP